MAVDLKFECQATAALLRSAAPLVWASQTAAVLTGVALGANRGVALFSAVSLAAWVVALYFAVRVLFDAAAFELLAADPEAMSSKFDGFLDRTGLRRAGAPRNIALRCQRAARLWIVLVAVVCFQLCCAGVVFFQLAR